MGMDWEVVDGRKVDTHACPAGGQYIYYLSLTNDNIQIHFFQKLPAQSSIIYNTQVMVLQLVLVADFCFNSISLLFYLHILINLKNMGPFLRELNGRDKFGFKNEIDLMGLV